MKPFTGLVRPSVPEAFATRTTLQSPFFDEQRERLAHHVVFDTCGFYYVRKPLWLAGRLEKIEDQIVVFGPFRVFACHCNR